MKITNRILSTLLAVIMVMGTLALAITVPAAADAPVSTGDKAMSSEEIKQHYLEHVYNTPEEKLADMTWKYTDASGRYELYADVNTGEVACLDTATGNILFTNPYDVATISNAETKYEILSQILIECRDTANNKYPLSSFKDAALNEQIKVQQIKKGLRVEYTIGREDTKKLIPKVIMGPEFEEFILNPLQAAVDSGEMKKFDFEKLKNCYNKQDIQNMSPMLRADWLTKYPCLKDAFEETGKYPDLWIFIETTAASSVQECENMIKKYTDYSYELLDEHHEVTGYVATDALYPAVKLALEYYVDANGMSVRLPCNGLRYDMVNFRIESISVLPFIGAGNYTQEGYAFFPDGSGALFDYQTMRKKNFEISGQVYGADYAFREEISLLKYQRVVRYPVYGSVSTEKIYEYTYSLGTETFTEKVSATVKTPEKIKAELEDKGATLLSDNFKTPVEYKRGFFAMVEEGDSLMKLKVEHGAKKHNYAMLRNYFQPVSLDRNENGVKLQSRKYTGSISIRFVMLNDKRISDAAGAQYPSYAFYDASWQGMAKAYREYLDQIGVLDRLTENDVEEDIPLYIESFGALETQETIATIPVYLMTPLTTFDNLKQIYSDLASKDVKNINFKMTGFANGGMTYKVPSALKWEKVVGGKDGFKDLVSHADKINKKDDGSHLGLYPDFDFAYIYENTLFDSVNLKKDAVKSLDNRYTAYREYSPTQQTFTTFYQLALSPSRFSKFYTKLLENYAEYGLKSISVASLGNTLNSDFDEDEPYNREENKAFTTEALAYIANKGYSIMTDGGNAYTWKYVDHILNVSLDSSRYLEASASVPFIGMVLHGYVQFAGTPLNEEGDANYAVLRAIENGASLYFILSYQNTAELKNDPILSQYYSIRYDIWKKDVVAYYNELNSIMRDVQTKQIIDHQFLIGNRILDTDELWQDINDRLDEAARDEAAQNHNSYVSGLNSVTDAWDLLNKAEGNLQNILADVQKTNVTVALKYASALEKSSFAESVNALNAADAAVKALANNAEATDEEKAAAKAAYDDAFVAVTKQIEGLYNDVIALLNCMIKLEKLLDEAADLIDACPKAIEMVENSYVYNGDEETRELLLAQMREYFANAQPYLAQIEDACNDYSDVLDLDRANSDSIFVIAANSVNAAFDKSASEIEEKLLTAILGAAGAYVFDMDHLDMLYDAAGEKSEDKDEDTVTTVDRTQINNNRIVAVTYGEGDVACKTFILNYNSFAVRVVYNGIVYTIASGDYAVVSYN